MEDCITITKEKEESELLLLHCFSAKVSSNGSFSPIQ